MSLNRQTLIRRIGTAVGGLLVLFLFVWLLPKWCLHLLLVGLCLIGVMEFETIAKAMGYRIYRTVVFGTLFLGIASIYTTKVHLVWVPYLSMALCGLVSLFPGEDMKKSFPQVGISLLATAYLGFTFIAIAYLFNVDVVGRMLVTFCLLMVWAGDTTAYFVGSMLGKHKIAPKASPKKTYEGTFGNLLGNFAMAWLAKSFVFPQMDFVDVIVLSLAFGLLGFFGDIIESTWKRGAGIKDSGHIFPGHGGLLDRIDSIFMTAPILYVYMKYVVLNF